VHKPVRVITPSRVLPFQAMNTTVQALQLVSASERQKVVNARRWRDKAEEKWLIIY
jgi:hypothetical protein